MDKKINITYGHGSDFSQPEREQKKNESKIISKYVVGFFSWIFHCVNFRKNPAYGTGVVYFNDKWFKIN